MNKPIQRRTPEELLDQERALTTAIHTAACKAAVDRLMDGGIAVSCLGVTRRHFHSEPEHHGLDLTNPAQLATWQDLLRDQVPLYRGSDCPCNAEDRDELYGERQDVVTRELFRSVCEWLDEEPYEEEVNFAYVTAFTGHIVPNTVHNVATVAWMEDAGLPLPPRYRRWLVDYAGAEDGLL